MWGFRAIASGRTGCCQFTAGFNRAFSMDNDAIKSQHGGTAGRLALNALKSFSYQLGVLGTRKITLSSPGTFRVTADEFSIFAALAAAQKGKDDLCHLHLTWLLAQHDTVYAAMPLSLMVLFVPKRVLILKALYPNLEGHFVMNFIRRQHSTLSEI